LLGVDSSEAPPKQSSCCCEVSSFRRQHSVSIRVRVFAEDLESAIHNRVRIVINMRLTASFANRLRQRALALRARHSQSKIFYDDWEEVSSLIQISEASRVVLIFM